MPILCPFFRLFVLGDLEQYGISTWLEPTFAHVLVDLLTGVINRIGGQQLTVQPDLVSIDATDSYAIRLAKYIKDILESSEEQLDKDNLDST